MLCTAPLQVHPGNSGNPIAAAARWGCWGPCWLVPPFSVLMSISMAGFQRFPLSLLNAQRATAFSVVIIDLDVASRPLSTTAQTVKNKGRRHVA